MKQKIFLKPKFARNIKSRYSIIGKYERDEVKPTIDVVKKLANNLQITVGYLLGETENTNLFKDPAMLTRLSELEKMDSENKFHIITVVDSFIKAVKFKNIAVQ